ncbi:MAG: tetratricopeptide repeat protein [Sulfurimonas sp.]|nr:tetratricopeptide repeat protein [Sulfurimonas sp.]
MAVAEEEIVIIAEDDAAEFDGLQEETETPLDYEAKKKKIIIFGGAAIALTLIILIVLLIVFKSSPELDSFSMDTIEEKLLQNKQKPIEPSKLENMIAKANYLYSSGSKKDALNLYEKIAQYSEAISLYNLGVAQLKNEQYELALTTFQKAINNHEKRCVSAINAAVCSLHLKDEENFKYYIDLAYAYLPNEFNSPLYSYYYTLINYYNKNYLEALSSLANPSSKEYPEVQKHLSAKINALFENNYDAIEAMEKNVHPKDSFSLALLYARVGDLTLAQQYLEDSILKNSEPAKAQLALGFIKLKAGQISSGAKEIQNVTDMFPEEVYKDYPIKVTLKDTLFDAKKAQKAYREKVGNSKLINYQKIFYFSPYKIFNAKQTISYIRKGNANIYIDNIASAKNYLKKSSSSSLVNKGIATAIKKALSFHIRAANNDLQKLIEIQPKHSILHYNLALTFAQMGDMKNAHQHFLRSYHLDAKNYLSGVYAVMTSQLIDKENMKMQSILRDSINQEEPSESRMLYKTLLNISNNNVLSSIDWLNNDYKQRPLYLAMDIVIALNLNRLDYAQKSSKKLSILLPNDILPHMMYIDSYFSELNDDKYPREVYKYLKNTKLNFADLYFGPAISRYLYIQQNLITGRLFFLREHLKDLIATTKEPLHELISSLAFASLLDGAYEESYTLYNQLIDELKVRDAKTLFLGAVASTAAGHHENAIALLELSKMKDKTFAESRYALGLLYLEIQNNEGAVIQLSNVANNSFVSEYFNFDIDTDKLLGLRKIP